MNAQLAALILNLMQAGYEWFERRGVTRDRTQTLLNDHVGTDFTDTLVNAELDATDDSLDETDAMLSDN